MLDDMWQTKASFCNEMRIAIVVLLISIFVVRDLHPCFPEVNSLCVVSNTTHFCLILLISDTMHMLLFHCCACVGVLGFGHFRKMQC